VHLCLHFRDGNVIENKRLTWISAKGLFVAATNTRGCGCFLVGEETWRSRALDVQFLHPASERVWMKTQYKSGTLGSFNDPIRIL